MRQREKKEKKLNTDTGFTQKKLNSSQSQDEESRQVPAWIIVVFLFALVFCLFAIYKVFIYGKGYDTPQTPTESINLLAPENTEVITIDSGALTNETPAGNQAS